MPANAKETCFEDLRQRILTTELEPGSDLDETSLSDHYGISRTPLREVLQRLSGEGFIRIEAHRGAKVASMDVAVLRVFFQTAPMIYAHVARLAAENHSAEELTQLKADQLLFAAEIADGDPVNAALCNHRFHATIGQMAHNPYLVAGLDRLLIDHTRLSQTFFRPEAEVERRAVTKAVEQHEAMIAAIEARNTGLVIDLTLQHWDLSRDRMERFVRPDPLPVNMIPPKDQQNAI